MDLLRHATLAEADHSTPALNGNFRPGDLLEPSFRFWVADRRLRPDIDTPLADRYPLLAVSLLRSLDPANPCQSGIQCNA